MAYAFFDGWFQWQLIVIGLGFATAIHVWAFGFEYLERRFDVGEARFDSETGQPIPDRRDGR
ncbi:hypothetical protein [Erythrobacter sp. JK5]|uniref:hypothetical protein n=1 Tax=Erythrobacter sp. JK5 TaxID=2829500 RepID=UPI001BAE3E14|nr:hypothetical protein [Erythrobacter sp. JK5]QUL36625.1 hypothetical protein KDC96_09255 [Erythrobacter sp. JK5]